MARSLARSTTPQMCATGCALRGLRPARHSALRFLDVNPLCLQKCALIAEQAVGQRYTELIRASLSKKKPRSVNGGARFLFFSKEVTANSITGDRVFLIVIGSGSSCFYNYCSSGVKILFLTVFVILRSYTSLGQSNKSKTCANPPVSPRNSSI